MDSRTITKTLDGGFIVAGTSNATKKGWATRIDSGGKVLWNFERGFLAEDKPYEHVVIKNRGNALTGAPLYRAAAAMPNGSIYLCGYMPRPIDIPNQPNQVGMLTHLDSNGKVINEQFILNNIHDCIAWQDGIVIVGSTSKPIAIVNGVADFEHRESSYVVIALDANGNKKWENSFPMLPKNAQENWSPPKSLPYNYGQGQRFQAADTEEGTVLLSVENNLIFSATDYGTTELISLNVQGKLIAQKKLNGNFRLIHPTIPDGVLQALGSFYTGNKSPYSILFLDEKLGLIRLVQSDSVFNFLTRQIYRLPDQSLVLFGSHINIFGEDFTSGVIHVDKDLKNTKKIDLEKSGYRDIGTIYAASPSQNPSKFIFSRSFATESGEVVSDGSKTGFIRGAVINFIRL